MECLEAIRSRKSIRRFGAGEIPRETIMTILEAGRYAPSGGNSQPWRFVVIESPKKKAELQRLIEEREKTPAQRRISETSQLVIAVIYERTTPHGELKGIQGIGACIQNILLAVHALGLGACWMGYHRDTLIEDVLECSYTEELMALIAIGIPDENPPRRPRRSLDATTRFL